MKHSIVKKITASTVLSVILTVGVSLTSFAYESEEVWGTQNEETGYYAYIDDAADLLNYDEEEKLVALMEPCTAHGHIGLVTIDRNPYYDTEEFANDYIISNFGAYTSGTVLVIDMDTRLLTIWSDGDNLNKVTQSMGTVITDNIYEDAKAGNYYRCASKAFEQIESLLEGNKISQPMKYVCNGCLSILAALIITYLIAKKASSTSKAKNNELLESMFSEFKYDNLSVDYAYQTKEYSPRSKSSGGGGHGGGGGGGHSGGGGSHGF